MTMDPTEHASAAEQAPAPAGASTWKREQTRSVPSRSLKKTVTSLLPWVLVALMVIGAVTVVEWIIRLLIWIF